MMFGPLQKFYNLTLVDPLFAAEGLDLKNARRVVDGLEEQARGLERIYRKAYRWFCFRYQFTETFQPLSFLKRFLDCESGRRLFLAEPTLKNSESLLARYKKAARALRENAESYREAILAAQKAEKFSQEAVFQFLSAEFSLDKILQFADCAVENANILEKETEYRMELIRGNIALVFTPPAVNPILQKSFGASLDPGFKKALSWIEESFERNSVIADKFGPIYYETSQFGGVSAPHQFFAYMLKNRDTGNKRLMIVLADYYYFIDVKDTYEKGSLMHLKVVMKTYYTLGQPYVMRLATQPYFAFDLRYYADLASIADLHWRGSELKRALVEAERSSLFDLLLQDLYFKNKGFLARQEMAFRDHGFMNPLFGTFAARSYPAICYLPFNRSVWRKLREEVFSNSIFEKSFLRSFAEVQSRLPEEEFKKLFDVFGEFSEDYVRAFNEEDAFKK